MRKVLHILKNPNDAYALEVIKIDAGKNQVSLLLIQDAAGMALEGIKDNIFVLADDLEAGAKTAYPKVGYHEMLQMIFENDTVITW